MNRLIYGLGGLMGGIMVTLVLLFAFAWYTFTPIFPDSVTVRMHNGMSPSQVKSLLGQPQSTRELKSGWLAWRYSRALLADYCVVFDTDGNVQSFYEHD